MREFIKTYGWLVVMVVASLIALWDAANLMVVIQTLGIMASMLLFVGLVLDGRSGHGLFPDYDEGKLIHAAAQDPHAAAWIVIIKNIVIMVVVLLTVWFVRPAHSAVIPARALPLLPVLAGTIDKQWPAMPLRHIPAGQVEQESAWKERATLSTSRELGRGLTQMTIAYRKDGSERFNIYRSAIQMKPLRGWDWQADPYNPRMQLSFLVLQDRSNYVTVRRFMRDEPQSWKAALVCYNAGSGRWLQRRAVARAKGLPADSWDGGLDRAWTSGESALLYGRPLYQAVNEYPRVVFGKAVKYSGRV